MVILAQDFDEMVANRTVKKACRQDLRVMRGESA
jgi:hypothetical protein